MTDRTAGGGATAGDGAVAPAGPVPAPQIVTKRPGIGPAILLAMAVAIVVLLVWVTPRVDSGRAEWDAGTPVLVSVTADLGAGTAEVTEYGTDRSWSVQHRLLERVDATAVGARVQARVAGDCRCELLLEEPTAIPEYLLLVPVGLGAVAVPGILSRRRWRRLRRVLAGPARQVQLEPVWLRRTLGPPMWGVRVAGDGTGDTGDTAAARGDRPVVELAGTPASWFPVSGAPVAMFGPDPDDGLTVFQTVDGRAVGSTAPRSGPTVERNVFSWSGALAEATGLVPPTAPGALGVGGAPHQRVSVGGAVGGGAHGSLTLQTERVERSKFLLVAGLNAAWIAAYLVFEPSGAWLLGGSVVVFAGLAVVRRRVAARLATAAPFASWADRTAAGQAALAAAAMGFAPRAEPPP